jgi:PhnB protein
MLQDQPTDYPPLAPVLSVADARRALDCYSAAFGAVELYHLVDPATGRWAHLEIRLTDGPLLLLEEEASSTANLSGIAAMRPKVRLCLFVTDADALTARCVAAGMAVLQAPTTHFHGHRCALLRDPDGHEWMVSQPVERVSPSEMQVRWDQRRTQTSPGSSDSKQA